MRVGYVFRMKDSTDFYDFWLELQENGIYSSFLDLPSHWHGQFAFGDNEKNKTIVIFVFIFIPKW